MLEFLLLQKNLNNLKMVVITEGSSNSKCIQLVHETNLQSIQVPINPEHINTTKFNKLVIKRKLNNSNLIGVGNTKFNYFVAFFSFIKFTKAVIFFQILNSHYFRLNISEIYIVVYLSSNPSLIQVLLSDTNI